MTREQMIEVLIKAGIRAVPTVRSEDMGLEYDFITPKGAGKGAGMGAWPLWRCTPINEKKWNEVVKAIQAGEVTVDVLHGTGLDVMLDCVQTFTEEVEYAKLLRKLPVLNRPEMDYYSLFDDRQWYNPNDMVEFYLDEVEVLRAFADCYCRLPISWSDMSDQEITTWYERLSDDLECMIYAVPSK